MNEAQTLQNSNNIMDIIILAAGAYMIYAGLLMKSTGKIAKSFISRNIEIENAPQKDKYIKYMFLPTMFIGVLMLFCGLLPMVVPMMNIALPENFAATVYFVSLGLVIAFGVYAINMQNRYLKNH